MYGACAAADVRTAISAVFSASFSRRRGLTPFATGTYTGSAGRLVFPSVMHKNLSLLLALLAAVAAAVAVTGLRERTAHAQASSRERTLYASVVDREGEPVAGLGPNDFIVREDNVRREVLRVSRAVEPIDLALVVDNSAAAADDIRNIRDAITAFVREMHKENDIALIALADRPTILADYTRDMKRLNDGIGRLFALPGSGMLLLDAIVDVSRGLARREAARAAVVAVITDGVEFSNLHHQTVVEALVANQVAFHAVTIGTFGPSLNEALRQRALLLDEGPRRSGGQRVTLLSSMAAEQALARLGRELANQYKVVYGRPEALIQPERVTVEVARQGLTARGTPERRRPGA